MSDNTDGWKNWIGRWVAYKLFPAGTNGEIDPGRDISGNAKAYAPTISVEVNFLARQVAATHNFSWENITPSEVETLKTNQDLVNLVVKKLTDIT